MGTDGLLGGLCVLLLFAGIVRHRTPDSGVDRGGRHAAVVSMGIGWVILTAMPLLLPFYVSPTLEGSRYLYLPCVGFALGLSAAFCEPGAAWRNSIAMIASWGAVFYGIRLHEERGVWQDAARTRDALLLDARAQAQEQRCRTVTVQGAPDTVRGVFVFRKGLGRALATLPLDPSAPCVLR
jgi:hypothetical protein